MVDRVRRQALERIALGVLEDDKVTALPVKPLEIAARRDIEVHTKNHFDGGVSGMLIRHGDRFAILYATHLGNPGFERFSVSHELGHYFVDGHPQSIFADTSEHASGAGFSSGNPIELEADHFAAALLMPRKLFAAAVNRRQDGLDAVESLAALCETSLTATAVRYVETTSAMLAVVLSHAGRVDYCFMSRALEECKGLGWIRKGTQVPRGTATHRLNADADKRARAERDDDSADIRAWFTTDLRGEVVEEAVGLGSYDRTLTVLSVELHEDEEEEPDDRWDPRFR